MNFRTRRSSASRRALALGLAALLTSPLLAYADEPAAPQASPRETPAAAPQEMAPTTEAAPDATSLPLVDARNLDLLPIDDAIRGKLHRDHPRIAGRLGALQRRGKRLHEQLRKRKDRQDAGSRKLRQQIKTTSEQARQVVADLMHDAELEGLTLESLQVLADLHYGAGRIQRYGRALLFAIVDLRDDQRELLTAVTHRMEGAALALTSQHERLKLGLQQQAESNDDLVEGLKQSFQAQERQTERRFFQFCDYILDRSQRAAWFQAMPPSYLRKQNPIEHLYTLPGLTPEQAARSLALLTEFEAEASTDQASIRRLNEALKAKGLDDAGKRALRAERQETQVRLRDLGLFLAEETKKVLTDEQILAYYAIPPRLSANDRREKPEQVLQGFRPSADQAAALKTLKNEARAEVRALQKRVAEIRREGMDYGPDSPQQMMMMSMMAGAQGDGARFIRRSMGRAFLEVLTPHQASAWVLGHWGRKR